VPAAVRAPGRWPARKTSLRPSRPATASRPLSPAAATWQESRDTPPRLSARVPAPRIVAEPFEDWMAHHMRRPADSPEATFIAGQEVVGFAKLSLTAPAAAGHAITAVKRAWRGRGIAGALKAAEINWALANGYTELHTSNEERNTPIKRLNARLGYRPGTGRIHLVGPIISGLSR
jgi:GNAT superfamily N-acetyltransferase